jgi:hypothetical protein
MAGESMAGQQTGAKRRVARAGIDVRSSTRGFRPTTKGKTRRTNCRQLRESCQHAGHNLVHEYVDHESGRNIVP